LGYSVEETGAVPEGSNLGLGCDNPQAIAALKPGETVLDLGSGGKAQPQEQNAEELSKSHN
jgi:hypothetical protein